MSAEIYTQLSNKNSILQKTILIIQRQLESLCEEKSFLEQQIASSPLNHENSKLLNLADESNITVHKTINDFNSFQPKYLKQMEDDHTEIANLENSINKLNQEQKDYREQLERVQQDLQKCQDDWQNGHFQRKSQEEIIAEFLLPQYNEMMSYNELERADKLKSEIESTLTNINRQLTTLRETKNETKANKNQSYMHYKQKQLYLEKLEVLETKLQSEIGNLYNRIEKTQSEIAIYENLGALRDEADAKRYELLQKKQLYFDNQNSIRDELKIVRKKYEEIQKDLLENETHEQLHELERKLIQIELNNSALKEFITEKRCEMNYEAKKKYSIESVEKCNVNLKSNLEGRMPEIESA